MVLKVKLNEYTNEFYNKETEMWVDLNDCIETDGILIDPSGYEIEIIN